MNIQDLVILLVLHWKNWIADLEGGCSRIRFFFWSFWDSCRFFSFEAGDHILLGDDVYGGTFRLFDKVLTKNGLEYTHHRYEQS